MYRLFDIAVSMLLIFLLLPLYIITSILILIVMGKPILFLQKRAGLKAKPFTMIKFRTMKTIYDNNGDLLPNIQRTSRFGQFLRTTSIDELPELINVLLGEMSLVGPRPLLMEYVKLYTDRQKIRMDVKPGITGWAQINGRNSISWEEKFELDIWYVENKSIILYIRILIKTIFKVFKRDGISHDTDVSMPRFRGSK